MIDQTATDYDAPAVYLPKLIEWADNGCLYYSKAADSERIHSRTREAMDCDVRAVQYRHTAQWARGRLMDIVELTLDGVEPDDAPPAPLVDLTAWLKGKLERHFPHMRPELWQALAAVLRPFRRQS
jgi:hypothetical protein